MDTEIFERYNVSVLLAETMYKTNSTNNVPPRSSDWSPENRGTQGEDYSHSFTTLRQVLFPRILPEPESMNDFQLLSLLNEVESELMQKQYRMEFLDGMPPRTAYRGLLQMLDSPLSVPFDLFQMVGIDGCDSACESCFQLAYCPVAREVLGLDWRKVLEQAGCNPSWAALYANDAGLSF